MALKANALTTVATSLLCVCVVQRRRAVADKEDGWVDTAPAAAFNNQLVSSALNSATADSSLTGNDESVVTAVEAQQAAAARASLQAEDSTIMWRINYEEFLRKFRHQVIGGCEEGGRRGEVAVIVDFAALSSSSHLTDQKSWIPHSRSQAVFSLPTSPSLTLSYSLNSLLSHQPPSTHAHISSCLW